MSVDVDVLIHDHKKAIPTIDGIEFHWVPSLISQLHDAITTGLESTGGSAAFASKLPIAAAALDLYMLIDRQIAEAWVTVYKRVPGVSKPERLLGEWAAHADPDTILTVAGREWTAETLVGAWQRRIEEFFDPPRLAEIAAACFVCGERYVYTHTGGEDIRSAALRFNRDKDTNETLDARCMACGTIWLPHQFDFLGTSIGIDVEKRKQEHEEKVAAESAKLGKSTEGDP